MGTTLDARAVRAFRARVWEHYRRHGREMPWRRTDEPYAILVSEVMLQQTPVVRVRAKYEAFLEAFPDFDALAVAPLARVLALWRGLGYNRRALALRRAAGVVVTEWGGFLPRDPEALATLPGIGRATAAAICAFAFRMPVVFVETNIRRVFLHEFFPGREAVRDAEILPLVARALDVRRPREWYHALMDLGASLKAREGNPNRRSAGYRRQAPFEGSDRQVRGRILRQVLEAGPVAAGPLSGRLGAEPARVRRLVAELEREGFLVRAGGRYAIAPAPGGRGRPGR